MDAEVDCDVDNVEGDPVFGLEGLETGAIARLSTSAIHKTYG
jgi:hypothetical protein